MGARPLMQLLLLSLNSLQHLTMVLLPQWHQHKMFRLTGVQLLSQLLRLRSPTGVPALLQQTGVPSLRQVAKQSLAGNKRSSCHELEVGSTTALVRQQLSGTAPSSKYRGPSHSLSGEALTNPSKKKKKKKKKSTLVDT